MSEKVDDQGVEYCELQRVWHFTFNIGGWNHDSCGYICKADAMLAKQAVWDAIETTRNVLKPEYNGFGDH